MQKQDTSIRILVELIDQAFDLKAWHGPNLRGAIRRLTAEQAAWRPRLGRHSIAEIVVHCAYWKYAVRRKLRGVARGSFAVKGSNWFPQLVHCAYWKYAVRRKLRGDARGSFAVKGSNWFPQPDDLSERDWKQNVDTLCQEHVALRSAVTGLNPANLLRQAPNSRYTYAFLIQGAAAHDLYHAGQIQVLKRLQA
jgi:hypothetical protein